MKFTVKIIGLDSGKEISTWVYAIRDAKRVFNSYKAALSNFACEAWMIEIISSFDNTVLRTATWQGEDDGDNTELM